MVEQAKSADHLAQRVAALFEPASRYRDRVSLSFEATRAFRSKLDVLAQSLEPLKGLRDQVIEILNSIRRKLADLAMSLEAAKGLGQELSELLETLDTGSELQAQIDELSKVLGAAFQTKGAKTEKEPSEKTAPAEGAPRL